MNPYEIEKLKSILTQFIMKGCNIQYISPKNKSERISGRIVGLGFKPLWPSSTDSKIDKIEFNCLDQKGNLHPFSLYNIIGYEIISYDGDQIEESSRISFDMHIYSSNKAKDKDPFDKIRISIYK